MLENLVLPPKLTVNSNMTFINEQLVLALQLA